MGAPRLRPRLESSRRADFDLTPDRWQRSQNRQPVTRQPDPQDRSRAKSNPGVARPDSFSEDDRPLAEIRKNIHDALRMVSLHRWAFFVPFSVVTCTAFILSLSYPRTYRASTTFERRDDPVMLSLQTSAAAMGFKQFRSTVVRDLRSAAYMSEVVQELGLPGVDERTEDGALTEAADRRRTALARSLAGTLSVRVASPSVQLDIITITYTGPDPAIGRKLVDQAKRTYIRRTMKWIHDDFLTRQREYFQQEATEAQRELLVARRQEQDLRLENPLVDPANPGTISLKLAQLDMERRELLLRQREYRADRSAIEQMLAAVEAATVDRLGVLDKEKPITTQTPLSAEARALTARIRTLDNQVANLRSTRGMTDQHPEVASILKERAALTRRLEQPRDRDQEAIFVALPPAVATTTPIDLAARSERARLLTQLAAQEDKLKEIDISLQTNQLNSEEHAHAKDLFAQKQTEFAELLGDITQAGQRQRKALATVASIQPAITAFERGRLLLFSEGSPARGGSRPISPKASTVVLLALFSGLATGIVFVVLAEVFDHVFRTSSQVARGLGLPLLESIDEIVTAHDRRRRLLQRAVLTPIVVTCFVTLTLLTGAMAYLSIERPATFEKLRKFPEAAIHLFAGEPPSSKNS